MENSEKMKEQMTITEQIERFKKMKKDFFGEHYDPSMTLMENADARIERNTQIEEMAKDIASTPMGTVKPDLTFTEMGDVYKGEFIMRIAKHLYNADYRKQKEGEWIEEVRFAREGKVLLRHYKCNLCGVYLATQANFCPNCGAHMRGGKNE